ncbi:hypothetical protein GVN21_17180 [Caulobacter sp. SLTY]|uniref:hypothetical protein n=1 Tax=Caulobacter sp. SLTY TaxID=2683262 RepID=UPI0014136EDA|nr:hypothetical protein [Caulobacter sp. SLTY]NBB17101.1 hypothetical protein [Caulobacter sp. SLTY]
MSPILAVLLSLMLAQEAAPQPEAAEAPPTLEQEYPVPAGAPSDDYGLVAWCYGALSGHIGLYDKVIEDVEDIEVRMSKLPGAPPMDMDGYKTQRDAGRDTLKQFRRAMEAAEKASPKPIAPYGAENLRKGGQIWGMVRDTKDKKYLAREWMSWGLPGRCVPTAERLEAKSSLFGQALTYNVKPAAPPPPPPEDVMTVPTTPLTPDTTAAPVEGTPLGEKATDPQNSIDYLLPGEAAPAEQVAANPEDEAAEPAAPEEEPAAEPDATDEDAPVLRGPQD